MSKKVVVLDNGANTAKIGIAGPKAKPRIIANYGLKPKKDRRLFIADQAQQTFDFSGALFKRAFEKGYVTNWNFEAQVWDRLFSKHVLDIDPKESTLLVTEPPFHPSSLRKKMDEIVFEKFKFSSYYRTPAAPLSVRGYQLENKAFGQGASLVIDCGYSFSHISPVFCHTPLNYGIKRVDVGGKLLTNYLKEFVSYRSVNMMEETFTINDIKEKLCFVALNYLKELAASKNSSSLHKEYVLPDGSSHFVGYVRENKSKQKQQSSSSSSSSSSSASAMKRKLNEDEETAKRKPKYDQSLHRSNVEAPQEVVLKKPASSKKVCPYLDTINRKVLDFDFEKLCSISLANMNVYACLVCGKYYQGRGKGSHAYFHSLESDHHVFINLHNEKIYCLPDGYEVDDSSLEDIKYNLHPRFTKPDLPKLQFNKKFTHALDGKDYLPGTVGLNNIKINDWLNVVVQSLIRVPPIRDFFIIESNYDKCKSLLVSRFGELIAKMWNARNFKGHVSPHELLQAVAASSNKRFRIGQVADAAAFLAWFLNALHIDLVTIHPPPGQALSSSTSSSSSSSSVSSSASSSSSLTSTPSAIIPKNAKHKRSVINDSFQGEIRISIRTPKKPLKITKTADEEEKDKLKSDEEKEKEKKEEEEKKINDADYLPSVERIPFLSLSFSLPTAPLFKDSQDRTLIPQIPLFNLLNKFDGVHEEVTKEGIRKRYQITRLPRYLILHYKRFQYNNWFTEKNLTLVTFPLKNLDLKPYVMNLTNDLEELDETQLKARAKSLKIPVSISAKKEEIIRLLLEHEKKHPTNTKYDLIANIVHEGKPDKGTYRAHIYQQSTDTWYEMQDLHVWTTETMPQLVALSEAYIQIFERKS
eukprot:TRINITY_DN813_c1_g2_i2.p1 TRINITY_DN813_c1_g2~~TRINITY_DN813_c1_g2_i2.p1  ORF type:complete len:867 (-),score=249.41 TRINITY_DN813_c1_g2_i2:1468-4068(-)